MSTITEKLLLALINKQAIKTAIEKKLSITISDDMSTWAAIINSIQCIGTVTMKVTGTGSSIKIFNDSTWVSNSIALFTVDGESTTASTSLTLDEGEHTITFAAFNICGSCFYGCTALTYLSLPNTISSIGSSFISGCSSLTSIEMTEGIETIGDNAFSNTYLTSITFPDSVKTIGSSCFTGNSNLTNIVLPANLKSIGNSACSWTSCIKYVSYNNDVEHWIKVTKGTDWANGSGFGTVTCTDGIVYAVTPSSTQIFYSTSDNTAPAYSDFGISYNYGYYNSDYGALNFGSDCTSIPSNAFSKITQLTGICLPSTITSISVNAFNGCTNLVCINFNNTVDNWSSITFDDDWKSGSGIIQVICTDGVINYTD